jgi:exopolysaccharide biosynthesis protein
MKKPFKIIASIFFLTYIIGCGTNSKLPPKTESAQTPVYQLKQISDTLFNSKQKISLLILPKELLNKSYSIQLAYNKTDLTKTSELAAKNNAVAAINGGFFNIDEGGSVTYFERNDTVIGKTRDPKLKWGVSDSIINGAIILSKKNKLKIEAKKTEAFYTKSKNEAFVLFTGPLLISNTKFQKLPKMKFSNKRHPRTCIGISKNSIIFIAIDGRSKQADGMSLNEVQKYLHSLGCTDAINLDGGGSTTMWTKSNGIINSPSDKKGERPVANALLIKVCL